MDIFELVAQDHKMKTNSNVNRSEPGHSTHDPAQKSFENQFDESEFADSIQESVAEVADQASDFIRKYPLQSAAGALVVGFLLGRLFSNRKSS